MHRDQLSRGSLNPAESDISVQVSHAGHAVVSPVAGEVRHQIPDRSGAGTAQPQLPGTLSRPEAVVVGVDHTSTGPTCGTVHSNS